MVAVVVAAAAGRDPFCSYLYLSFRLFLNWAMLQHLLLAVSQWPTFPATAGIDLNFPVYLGVGGSGQLRRNNNKSMDERRLGKGESETFQRNTKFFPEEVIVSTVEKRLYSRGKKGAELRVCVR